MRRHRLWIAGGWVLALVGTLLSCRPNAEPSQPAHAAPTPLTLAVPANLPKPPAEPVRNPLTQEGVVLGRKLFFDPLLSRTNTISCASCHQPAKGFADGVTTTMGGVSRHVLPRHTPSLQNLAWAGGYFWDGGATDLESQAFGPLINPDEMAQDLPQLLQELKAAPEYAALFEKAFPGQGISSSTLVRALAQFERTLISANSPYDHWVRGEGRTVLTADELTGRTLVQQKCGPCHTGDLFTDYGYHNNGLDTAYSTAHERLAWARGRITDRAADIGKYRTPTLRNVALTAPYMHDGRFATLDEVFDHYTGGVRPSATLDTALRRPDGAAGIAISPTERRQMLAFLQTLSDTTFVRP